MFIGYMPIISDNYPMKELFQCPLATLRYFSPPNLAQSGHGGNPASKKQKYWLQEPVQV